MYLHADKQTSAAGCFVQMEALEKRSLRLCVAFLEQIAKMTSNVVLELCAEQNNLSEKVKRKLIISRRLIQPKSTSIYSLPPWHQWIVAGGRGQNKKKKEKRSKMIEQIYNTEDN